MVSAEQLMEGDETDFDEGLVTSDEMWPSTGPIFNEM